MINVLAARKVLTKPPRTRIVPHHLYHRLRNRFLRLGSLKSRTDCLVSQFEAFRIDDQVGDTLLIIINTSSRNPCSRPTSSA